VALNTEDAYENFLTGITGEQTIVTITKSTETNIPHTHLSIKHSPREKRTNFISKITSIKLPNLLETFIISPYPLSSKAQETTHHHK
jgi:hypothetical protein